jgi:hypothetical protein
LPTLPPARPCASTCRRGRATARRRRRRRRCSRPLAAGLRCRRARTTRSACSSCACASTGRS